MRTFVVGTLSIVAAALVGCSQSAAPQAEAQNASVTHIIGGQEDAVDQAVVAVLVFDDSGKGGECTGEIVAANFVLTAAHCVSASALGFTPTNAKILTSSKISTATQNDTLAVADLIPHPSYDPTTGANDIALIKLSQPTSIKPLAYNHGGMDGMDGAAVRAVGYGRTVDTDSSSADAKKTAAFTVTDIQNGDFLLQSPDASQCHGDSGGPVIATIDQQDLIIGIGWRTVRDDGSCSEGVRDTRVDNLAPWLDSVLDGSNDGSQDVTTA
jgi:secreted trypsin-like serine protease